MARIKSFPSGLNDLLRTETKFRSVRSHDRNQHREELMVVKTGATESAARTSHWRSTQRYPAAENGLDSGDQSESGPTEGRKVLVQTCLTESGPKNRK
jgi:hypothetical protein